MDHWEIKELIHNYVTEVTKEVDSSIGEIVSFENCLPIAIFLSGAALLDEPQIKIFGNEKYSQELIDDVNKLPTLESYTLERHMRLARQLYQRTSELLDLSSDGEIEILSQSAVAAGVKQYTPRLLAACYLIIGAIKLPVKIINSISSIPKNKTELVKDIFNQIEVDEENIYSFVSSRMLLELMTIDFKDNFYAIAKINKQKERETQRQVFSRKRHMIEESQLVNILNITQSEISAGIRLKILNPICELGTNWYPVSIHLSEAEIKLMKDESYLTRKEIQSAFGITNYQWGIIVNAGFKPSAFGGHTEQLFRFIDVRRIVETTTFARGSYSMPSMDQNAVIKFRQYFSEHTDELSELLRTTPQIKVAKKYSVSGTTIRKLCEELGIQVTY